MLITMKHIRAGGGCAYGLRSFFAKYDLDLNAFFEDGGIDAAVLRKTNDALALKVIQIAEREALALNEKDAQDGR